jgi:hypothetical protein
MEYISDMKESLLISFFVFAFSSHFTAQDCVIVGTWKNTGYEVDGKLKGQADTVHSYLTFYADGEIQSDWSSGNEPTIPSKYTGTGTYEFDGEKTLRIQYLNQDIQKAKVISCSDSSLVIEFNLIEMGRTRNYYRREKQMISLFVPEPASEVISPVPDENNAVFYLVSESKPEQKIKIKNWSDLRFTYSRDSPFFPKAKENILCDGRIIDVDSLQVKVEVDYYYANTEVDQDTCTIHMNMDYDVENGQVADIPLNQLEWIDYTTPSANTGQMIGSAMILVGIYSFLIATPIASLNSKKGTFDRDKAYLVGGASLGMIALSIPIFALSKTKHYKISKDVFCDEQEYWRIVKGE